jgi:hypothetical protein
MRCPRFCARLRPSAVRVRIRSRSTSAKPPKHPRRLRYPTAPSTASPAPMPLDAPRPEFHPLAPWPPVRFLNGRTERIVQNQLPPRPDPVSYTGSSAGLTADAEFAERGGGDFAPERRARDAERQKRKRAGARLRCCTVIAGSTNFAGSGDESHGKSILENRR